MGWIITIQPKIRARSTGQYGLSIRQTSRVLSRIRSLPVLSAAHVVRLGLPGLDPDTVRSPLPRVLWDRCCPGGAR